LKAENFAGNPSFWMIRAYFRAANLAKSSLFAPVMTIFPLLKMRAVVLGSRILMMTAAKRWSGERNTVDAICSTTRSPDKAIVPTNLWIVLRISGM
jgi:hypothetical protein